MILLYNYVSGMSGQPKTRLIPVIEALPLVEEWLA